MRIATVSGIGLKADFAGGGLKIKELSVETFWFLDKLRVGAALGHSTFCEYDDLISVSDSTKSVGNCEAESTLHELFESGLNSSLGF